MQKVYTIFLIFLLSVLSTSLAKAQIINETQRLNFGTWLISSNASNYNITLQANGSYSSSPQLVMLNPPAVGVYQVTGLPPFATISSVDVVMSQALEFGGSQSFTMDNFQSIIPNADGAGETILTLGARAVTSGTTLPYTDGTFAGTLDVTINF